MASEWVILSKKQNVHFQSIFLLDEYGMGKDNNVVYEFTVRHHRSYIQELRTKNRGRKGGGLISMFEVKWLYICKFVGWHMASAVAWDLSFKFYA